MDLATFSDHLFSVAVVLYAVAMLGYAAELAFGRQTRAIAVPAQHQPAPALVGAAVGGTAATSAPLPPAPAGPPAVPAGPERTRARRLGSAAIAVTAVGWVVHLTQLVTRGVAEHRVPWGNMYEFSSAVAFIIVGVVLALVVRRGMRWLGVFVLLPVVLYMGLAGTVLYAKAGPLVPALNSYWLKIHVVAAILATGGFLVSGVTTVLQLVRRRYDRLVADGRTPGGSALAARLPAAATLDRVTYGIVTFVFPVWTFAIIAGAIWAEAAWSRYWGWDPKETWSFITWVCYAAYLHCRSTASWRRWAPVVSLVACVALIVNYYLINLLVIGLHSYAGVN